MFKRIVGKFYKSDPSSAPIMPEGKKEEVFSTDKRHFACDGPEFSGHPRVYLTMQDDETQKFCPYCSRLYKFRG